MAGKRGMGRGVIAADSGQIIEITPSRRLHYYLVLNTDAGSIPSSATNYKGLDSLQALFLCANPPLREGKHRLTIAPRDCC